MVAGVLHGARRSPGSGGAALSRFMQGEAHSAGHRVPAPPVGSAGTPHTSKRAVTPSRRGETACAAGLGGGAHGGGHNRHVSFQTLPTVPSGTLSPGGTPSDAAPTNRAASGQLPAPSAGRATADLLPDDLAPGHQQQPLGPLPLPPDPSAPPAWAVQPPALLRDLLAPYAAAAAAAEEAGGAAAAALLAVETRWLAQVPEWRGHLAAPAGAQAAAAARGNGAGGEEAAGGGAASVSVQALLRCVLDLSPEEQPVQLEQVTRRLHAEVRRAVAAAALACGWLRCFDTSPGPEPSYTRDGLP